MTGFGFSDNDDVFVKGDDGTIAGKKIGVIEDALKVFPPIKLDKIKILTAILEKSKFLIPANFDSVVPNYSGDNVTLEFYEDTFLVATASFTYTSESSWSVAVEHLLLDDDGLVLNEDDDSNLLLE